MLNPITIYPIDYSCVAPKGGPVSDFEGSGYPSKPFNVPCKVCRFRERYLSVLIPIYSCFKQRICEVLAAGAVMDIEQMKALSTSVFFNIFGIIMIYILIFLCNS